MGRAAGRPKKKVIVSSSDEENAPVSKAKAAKKTTRKKAPTKKATTRKKRKTTTHDENEEPFESSGGDSNGSSSDEDEMMKNAVSPATLKLINKDRKQKQNNASTTVEMLQNFVNSYSPPSLSASELSWKKKYESLRELRETEAEKQYEELVELTKKERKGTEKLMKKLKHDYENEMHELKSALSSEKKKDLKAEHALEEKVGALEFEKDHLKKENLQLKTVVKELKNAATSSPKRKASPKPSPATKAALKASAAARNASITNMQLNEVKKILSLHEAATGLHISLRKDEADEESGRYTNMICNLGHPYSLKKLVFELALPHDTSEDIDYYPHEELCTMEGVPDYLLQEISFERSQLPKFIKTMLTVLLKNPIPDDDN